MEAPVGRIGGLLIGDPVARYIRNIRNLRRMQRNAAHDVDKRTDSGVHHARMERVRRVQRSGRNSLTQQLGAERRDSFGGARYDDRCWRIDRGDRNRFRKPRLNLFRRGHDGQHGASRHALHQTASRRHSAKRVIKRKNLRDAGRGEFADTVAKHHRRKHPSFLPKLRQGIRNHEYGGLRILGVSQGLLGLAFFLWRRKNQSSYVNTYMLFQQFRAAIDCGAEDRLLAVEFSAHENVLRALA